MGRYTGKSCRLICMMSLTASFFLVEIVVGYVTNSIALVGDSYHMLSDVIALVVGFASVRISKWHSRKNTFGWARAEVLGALVNAVFLIALCFTIFVEALQRLFHDEHIHDPDLMLIVGGIGLAINVIGLFMFHGHGHSHGGHGHSHGSGDSHNHAASADGHSQLSEKKKLNTCDNNGVVINPFPPRLAAEHEHDTTDDEDDHPHMRSKILSSSQMNMRGVFLHVLGDALGSIVVIISALVIKYIEQDWRYKVDPAMSMGMVIIILSTTIPLLKDSALILLQTVPSHIKAAGLQEKLIEKVEGVLAVHELHIWQLAGNRIIASAHIRCQNLQEYMRVAEDTKSFFHEEGIHSTTIQPEFVEKHHIDTQYTECLTRGKCDEHCAPHQCCEVNVDLDDEQAGSTKGPKCSSPEIKCWVETVEIAGGRIPKSSRNSQNEYLTKKDRLNHTDSAINTRESRNSAAPLLKSHCRGQGLGAGRMSGRDPDKNETMERLTNC